MVYTHSNLCVASLASDNMDNVIYSDNKLLIIRHPANSTKVFNSEVSEPNISNGLTLKDI